MKEITSSHNQEIKDLAALHTVKGRTVQQRFIAEGARTIGTLGMHIPIVTLYATAEQLERAHEFVSDEHVVLVSAQVMSKISTSESPPGLLALYAIPPQPEHPLTSGLVCAQINDPGNMGTLIRTAAAMNFGTVVISEGADPWSPKVVQASAGTIGSVRMYRINWQELITRQQRPVLAALVVTGGQPPATMDKNNTLCVVGNEAHGLSESWLADCDKRITLAMPGGTESLNAAVAGSIALYLLATAS